VNKKITYLIKLVFTISYFSILFYLVFFIGRRKHNYDYDINLIPLRNILREFRYRSLVSRFNYYSNIFGNILLFFPLPIILKMYLRVYKFSSVLLLAVTLSVSIESLQYIFEVGVADIDDVILNTLGACFGYLFITHSKNPLAPYIS
jgi:glycopeptide antibiotics resistance protein